MIFSVTSEICQSDVRTGQHRNSSRDIDIDIDIDIDVDIDIDIDIDSEEVSE